MPKITAQADVFRDWEAILGACAQNAALLPGVDPFKTELDALLAQAKDLKVQQENLEGGRLAITQRLMKVIDDGRETVRKIRAFAVVRLGTDNKQLTQFGVVPRQRRGAARKAKSPDTPPPAVMVAASPSNDESKERVPPGTPATAK